MPTTLDILTRQGQADLLADIGGIKDDTQTLHDTVATKADEVETARQQVSTNKDATTTSATNAAASESAAASSASAASASQSAAAASEATSTTNAATATTQAGVATTQAGIATTKAEEATTGATTATTQAGIATTKAGESAASAASALTYRDAAEGFKTAAETAKTGAETARDTAVAATAAKLDTATYTTNRTADQATVTNGLAAKAAIAGTQTFTGVNTFSVQAAKAVSISSNYTSSPSNSNIIFDVKNNGVTRTEIGALGAQTWYVNSGTAEVGQIAYSSPNAAPGIIFFNAAGTGRSQIRQFNVGLGVSSGGLAFGAGTTSTSPADQVVLFTTGNLAVNSTTDSGERLQVTGTAKFTGLATFQAGTEHTTAGAGIILKTPDGTKRYKITIDNSGNLITTLQ